MLLQLVAQVHDVHDVEQLSLVLVETLHLDVEDRVRVDFNAVVLENVLGQALLVPVLDLHELLLRLLVVGVGLQLLELGKMRDPAVADPLRDPLRELGIAVQEEAPLRNAVRLVVELLRHHLVEVLQHVLLKDLRVQRRDAVHRVAADDGEVSHVDLSVVDNRHVADLVRVVRILLLNLVLEAAVDLLGDLVNTGQQPREQVDRPLLERFRHDRVVRVRAGACRQIPGLVPAVAVLVHEEAHKLGDRDRRMRVIQLKCHLLRQIVECPEHAQMLHERFLHRRRDEEILLL